MVQVEYAAGVVPQATHPLINVVDEAVIADVIALAVPEVVAADPTTAYPAAQVNVVIIL